MSVDAHRRRAPRVPDGLRIYAIGDIHGCAGLLDRLHALIEADLDRRPPTRAHLVYLGDYIDRGPDSAGVLDRLAAAPLRGLSRTLLKGNHEEMLEGFLRDGAAAAGWRRLGGHETLLSYRVEVAAVIASLGAAALPEALASAMPDSHVALVASLLPAWSSGDYFFCHAGVRPGIALSLQRSDDLLWIRRAFLDAPADFEKVVVHGHTPVDAVTLGGGRIGIDTGAYMTGRLTCLVLEGGDQRLLST